MRRLIVATLAVLPALGLSPASSPAAAAPGEWTRIGPYGGAVSALAGPLSKPQVVYAGTSSGSVFRSADYGKSWSFAGLAEHQVFALAVDSKAPDTVYAGTGDGLFKTTDAGAHWVEIFPQIPDPSGQFVDLVMVDPRNPRIVWAGIFGTLWKSTDGGVHWTNSPSSPPSASTLAIDPTRSSTVYAGSEAGGVFKTTNGGRTWSLIGQGLPPTLSASAIAIDPHDRNTLLLANRDVAGEVFKSTDGGATWKLSRAGLAGKYVIDFAFDPSRASEVYALSGGSGVFKSTNGGRTWKAANAGLGKESTNSLLATRLGLLAGTDRGIYASADRAATWNSASTGLSALTILGLAMDRQDPPRLYAGSYSGVLAKTANRGATWLTLPTDLPLDLFYFEGPIAIDPHDPLTIYGMYTRGFAVSTNGGRRWTARDLGCLHASRVVLDATIPTIVYVNGFFVTAGCGLLPNACSSFRVDEDGASCVRHEPLGRTGAPVMAADPHAPGTVYAVAPTGLYRSPDRGVTWSLLAPGVGPGTLTFDPDQPGVVYGTFPGAVGRSGDGGATWSLSQEGFPTGAQVVSLAIDPGDTATVYASTLVHGVLKSTDSGASWNLLALPPPGMSFSQVVIDAVDPTILYVATSSASVLMLQQ